MVAKKNFYLYKPLISLEHLKWLENYFNQKIWLSTVDKFNDPYEGQFIYCPIEALTQNSQIGKKQVERFIEGYGILCLTTSFSNIPMWGHYANNHQGCCIIFELDLDQVKNSPSFNGWPDQEVESFLNTIINPKSDEDRGILMSTQVKEPEVEVYFLKVAYQNEIPRIEEKRVQQLIENKANKFDNYELRKYYFLNSIGVKSIDWNYENEFRLIVNGNANKNGLIDLRGYPFIKVVGVILGEALDESLQKILIELAKEYSIKTLLAKRLDSSYQIKIDNTISTNLEAELAT